MIVISDSLVEVPEPKRDERARALFSLVIGTASIARGLRDTELFDEMLANGREAAKRLLRG